MGTYSRLLEELIVAFALCKAFGAPFYKYGLNWYPAWIIKYIHYKVWDELYIHPHIHQLQPLKFGDEILSHTSLGSWLLILTWIKNNACKGPLGCNNRCFTGVVTTKPISSVPLFSQLSSIIKTLPVGYTGSTKPVYNDHSWNEIYYLWFIQ